MPQASLSPTNDPVIFVEYAIDVADTCRKAGVRERVAATALALGCRSAAFTYNDPVIFVE